MEYRYVCRACGCDIGDGTDYVCFEPGCPVIDIEEAVYNGDVLVFINKTGWYSPQVEQTCESPDQAHRTGNHEAPDERR